MTNNLPPPDHPLWPQWARTDPTLAHMLQYNQPLTREQWLKNNYLLADDGVPDPVPDEVETAMAPPFRLNQD